MQQRAETEIAAQAAKAAAATHKVLQLSDGMNPRDYKHPNFQKLQTAVRAFKREDGRLTRLRTFWVGQLALLAEGVIDEDGKWKDED